MCLDNITKARVIERDLVVFKVVRHITNVKEFQRDFKNGNLTSGYSKWLKLIKEGVYAEYSGYRFDIKELHAAEDYKKVNGMMELYGEYEPGFHAFLKKKDALAYASMWYSGCDRVEVMKFIVPKGSMVRHGQMALANNKECIVSSQLINPRFKIRLTTNTNIN